MIVYVVVYGYKIQFGSLGGNGGVVFFDVFGCQFLLNGEQCVVVVFFVYFCYIIDFFSGDFVCGFDGWCVVDIDKMLCELVDQSVVFFIFDGGDGNEGYVFKGFQIELVIGKGLLGFVCQIGFCLVRKFKIV